MGSVYRAERADGQFDQQVALKLLRDDLRGDDIRRRFLAERQILAGVSHPNIARLVDGGITEGGRPYFAMELVEGLPVDDYCDRQRLPIRDRLLLFAQVCDAVQYAHQNLIVHRDLKPGNILVTREEVPKLLDFGIAKLLEPGTLEPSDVTQAGARLLTPDYASPEQVRGAPITTASDVFQLGVLLYELLTGTRPFAQTTGSLEALGDTLAREASPPSKTVVREQTELANAVAAAGDRASVRGSTPERLRRSLRGDLDKIVLKAMRPEPERRYGTAGQLADDVRRHVAGRPVQAGPDTVRYRTSKFVRRNPVPLGLTAALMVSLAAFSLGTARQANRIAVQRDRSEQVVDFMVELFQSSDPEVTQGDPVTLREVLDRGAARVRAELTEQPEVQATLMTVVADVYRSLGVYGEAILLAEEALAIRQQRAAADPLEVARNLELLGWLQSENGDLEEAASTLEEAEQAFRAHADRHPAELARALNTMGYGWQVLRNIERAEPLMEESVALFRLLPPTDEMAQALINLGWLRRSRGDQASAETLFREALAVRRDLPSVADLDVGRSLSSLGSLLVDRGQLEEADQLLEESLAVHRRVYPDGHYRLADALEDRAALLAAQGATAESEELYREAIDLYRSTFGDEHIAVANARNDLALVLRGVGRLEAAEELCRQALSAYQNQLGSDHLFVAIASGNLGWVLRLQGKLDEALPTLQEALRIQRSLDDDHRRVVQYLVNSGIVRMAQGDLAAAESNLREDLEVADGALDPGAPELLRGQNALGQCLLQLARYSEAEEQLRATLAATADRSADDPVRAFATSTLIEVYDEWGRPEAAEALRTGG